MYFKAFPSFIVYQSGLSSSGVEKHNKCLSPASLNPPGKNFFRKMLLWCGLSGSAGVLKFLMMFCIFLLNEQEKTHLALIWILNRLEKGNSNQKCIPTPKIYVGTMLYACLKPTAARRIWVKAGSGTDLLVPNNGKSLSRGAGFINHIRSLALSICLNN